jgi:putative PIN family toxin of toxin-antitoxin system
MKCYAIIDTNVLVSAAIKPDSVPGTIFKLILVEKICPVFNSEILDEYIRVLSRSKFGLSKFTADRIVGTVNYFGTKIESHKIDLKFIDPDDKKFYEAFVSTRDKRGVYLITGNIRHFPVDDMIVTPRQMTDILKASFGQTGWY